MKTLKSQVQTIVEDAFSRGFPDNNIAVQVEYCDLQFGHFATNIALSSSKILKQSPLEIAQKLAHILEKRPEFAKVEVQKPGFVNIELHDQMLLQDLRSVYVDVLASAKNFGQDKKMIIDYSHPNIGKPMGVHHLLSTVIGDSIKRLYLQSGYEVIADNFVGDMGTQFGKLIHAVKTWGDMQVIEANPVAELLKLYVHFHIEAESDETLDDAGRAEYKKLEEGDAENRALLKKIQGWSMTTMLALYDELGVEFDYYNGESFYEDKIEAIIALGVEKGIFVESQGALVCETDNPDEPPALIRKKDGTSLYLTRDLARVAYWEKTWHPDYMVNVVDVAQSLQMKQVYEVSAKLGLTNAENVHVMFGRMQFADGSMSTRKGNIILVEDLIAETKKRVAEQIVILAKDLSKPEEHVLTDVLAINALKYNILKQNRQSNIHFDWDSMLSLEGNSAPYLAYSAVRMQAIERAGEEHATDKPEVTTEELDADEIELLLQVSRVNEVLIGAVVHFQPSDVANYCYELCRIYNSFYHTHKVIEDDVVRANRLLINDTCLRVVKVCFDAMGLKMPEKM